MSLDCRGHRVLDGVPNCMHTDTHACVVTSTKVNKGADQPRHAHLHACLHTDMWIRVYAHTCTRVLSHMQRTKKQTDAHTHTLAHTCRNPYARTHTCTHMGTHMHTQSLWRLARGSAPAPAPAPRDSGRWLNGAPRELSSRWQCPDPSS